MSFESNMENYKDTMSSIMGGELAASAQRIAEGADLGEDARHENRKVQGRLALDMLKEGILSKAGVSSALGRAAPTDLKGLVQAGLKDGLDHLKGKALEAAKARGLPTSTDEALALGKNKLAAAVKGQTGVDVSDLASAASPATAILGKAKAAAGGLQEQVSGLAEVATSGKVGDLVTTAKGFAGRGAPAAPAVAPKEEEEEEEEQGEDLTPEDLIAASREVRVDPNPSDTAQLRAGAADIFKTLSQPEPEPSAEPSAARQAVVQSEEGGLSETFGTALGGAGAVAGAIAAGSGKGLTGGQRSTAITKALAPTAAQELLGGLVPEAGLVTQGIEDFASKGGGSATQRLEEFGEQGLAIKIQQRVAQGVNKAINNLRGGGEAAGEEGAEDAGVSAGAGVSGGEGVSAGAGVSSGAAAGSDAAAATTSTTAAGAGAAEGAEGAAEGAGAAAAGEGGGSGLFAAADAAAAAGAETGGGGFLVAGLLGLAGVFASIFAPHHHKAPPPVAAPNLAIPVQAIGIN